jgi:hypothetical protein
MNLTLPPKPPLSPEAMVTALREFVETDGEERDTPRAMETLIRGEQPLDLNLIKPHAASTIGRDHLTNLPAPELRVVDGKDAHVNVYGLRVPLEDCWVVYVPLPTPMLRSSEIILVRKGSGEVVYHGSANDEG